MISVCALWSLCLLASNVDFCVSLHRFSYFFPPWPWSSCICWFICCVSVSSIYLIYASVCLCIDVCLSADFYVGCVLVVRLAVLFAVSVCPVSSVCRFVSMSSVCSVFLVGGTWWRWSPTCVFYSFLAPFCRFLSLCRLQLCCLWQSFLVSFPYASLLSSAFFIIFSVLLQFWLSFSMLLLLFVDGYGYASSSMSGSGTRSVAVSYLAIVCLTVCMCLWFLSCLCRSLATYLLLSPEDSVAAPACRPTHSFCTCMAAVFHHYLTWCINVSRTQWLWCILFSISVCV